MSMLFPLLMMGVYLAIPAALLYLAWRFVRSHERRSGGSAEIEMMSKRILALEERLDGVADTVDQLADGQRFTTDVLAARRANPQIAPSPFAPPSTEAPSAER
jgi:hypothetical protein